MKIEFAPAVYSTILILLSISACANNSPNDKETIDKTFEKAAVTPNIASTVSCINKDSIYFQCKTGTTVYNLCRTSEKNITFFEYNEKSIQIIFQSNDINEFSYSNYTRYKVIQNTVTFQDNLNQYEIFDYLGEDIDPPEYEVGLVINNSKDGSKINHYCNEGAISNLSFFSEHDG